MKIKNNELELKLEMGNYICPKCKYTSNVPLNNHDCGSSYPDIDNYYSGKVSFSSLHPIDQKIIWEQS